jgi:hypothetical protein
VEIGHRQELGFTVFHPRDLGTGLARRAVPRAPGMLRVSLEATGGTGFSVPTGLRWPAGLTSVHPLLLRG